MAVQRVRAHGKRSPRGRLFQVRRYTRKRVPAQVIVGAMNPEFEDELSARMIPKGKAEVFTYMKRPDAGDGRLYLGEQDPFKVDKDHPYVSLYWNPGDQIRLEWYFSELEGPKIERGLKKELGIPLTEEEKQDALEGFEPNWHEDVFDDTTEGAAEASRKLTYLLKRPVIVKNTGLLGPSELEFLNKASRDVLNKAYEVKKANGEYKEFLP